MDADPQPERREKRGRKSVLVSPSKLAIWVPGELYDRLIAHAKLHHAANVAGAARALLETGLHSDSLKTNPEA